MGAICGGGNNAKLEAEREKLLLQNRDLQDQLRQSKTEAEMLKESQTKDKAQMSELTQKAKTLESQMMSMVLKSDMENRVTAIQKENEEKLAMQLKEKVEENELEKSQHQESHDKTVERLKNSHFAVLEMQDKRIEDLRSEKEMAQNEKDKL